VIFVLVRYPVTGAPFSDGYIQFRTERHALEGLKRLTSPKMRKKMHLDIWYAPSRPREFDQVAPTSSSPEPPPAPNPDPLPQPPQSAETHPIQQQNALSHATGEDSKATLIPLSESSPVPTLDPLPKPREITEKPPVWQEDLSQIFVGCLPTWIPQQEIEAKLREIFEPFGQIKWLRVGEISRTDTFFLAHKTFSLWAEYPRRERAVLSRGICESR
jgi:hypothetical protein